MQRAILTPPVLPAAALDALKAWLGVTTARDDGELAALLAAALDLGEGFTGQLLLACTCEETLPARCAWQELTARPVQAITGLDALAADGTRRQLDPGAYAIDLAADGGGRVQLTTAIGESRIVARYAAGLAPSWAALPEALRQGLIRLAAHQHREREADKPAPVPPAAVAALWRPWRRVRVA